MLYIKTIACRMFLYLWVKIAGTQPDYSELIERRALMIEKSINRAVTWYQLNTCKEAITVLLRAPFPKEAASHIGKLNSLLHWKEQELINGFLTA